MAEKIGSGRRFRGLAQQLNKPGVRNPNALAAAIGRKKLGAARFQALADAGRRRAAADGADPAAPAALKRVKV